MKKILLSRCASVERYVFSSKPNPRIPFKGDFPIVKDWQANQWREMFDKYQWLEDCPDWFRETIAKGQNIEAISYAFDEYLKDAGVVDFDKLSNADKADWLVRFLNKNCMNPISLSI